jgi:hypothetical protein
MVLVEFFDSFNFFFNFLLTIYIFLFYDKNITDFKIFSINSNINKVTIKLIEIIL